MKIIVYEKFHSLCWWSIVAGNGYVIVSSPKFYARRWTANRAAENVLKQIKLGNVEIVNEGTTV